jgi:protoheme IX farnesyltransferase
MACRDYLELAKIRVTGMVLVTTAVGYVLGSKGAIRWPALALVVAGTGLAVVGAAALNQLLEIDRDAKMRRTRNRPLPAGRVTRTSAFAFGMAAVAAGLGVLNKWVSPLCCVLGLVDVLLYVLVYTPLKTRTSLNTLVGSVCGALPPVMGWAAAAGGLSLDAALLGGILLLWQVPHSLSFVWLYRDDYAAAGYRMLPVVDPRGRLTCLAIILWWLALLPLGLVVAFRGVAGWLFAAASLALGVAGLLAALRLRGVKTERNARRMFVASIIYLPLLMAAMVADRPTRRPTGFDPPPNGAFTGLVSDEINDDEQHAPNGVQKVPVDGRIPDARMPAGGVAAAKGSPGDDGQRHQPDQHVGGVQAREHVK